MEKLIKSPSSLQRDGMNNEHEKREYVDLLLEEIIKTLEEISGT